MDNKLQEAVALYKKGDKAQASKLLAKIVRQEPSNSVAWYGLALCLDEFDKKVYCLKKVLSLDPTHEKARQLLEKLQGNEKAPSVQKVVKNSPASATAKKGTLPKWLGLSIVDIIGVIFGVIFFCVVGGIMFANNMNIFQPTPTLIPTRIPPTRTPPPTATKTPMPTPTPIPTSTPILYTANASDYVLSKSEVPNGFFVLPEQTGAQTAYTTSGFISGYIVTYKNGNSGILGVLSPTGYVFSVQIYVFNNSDNATQEFEYRASLTKDTDKAIVKSAGDKVLEGCDKAHLLLGVYDLDGAIANDASLIFQKKNVVGVVTSIGTAGAPSFGIDVDIETATKNRINEVSYYTALVLNKIK